MRFEIIVKDRHKRNRKMFKSDKNDTNLIFDIDKI